MVPSPFHAPPSPSGAWQRIWTALPALSATFSLRSAKKPMRRLSGDQKGNVAPSAPVICWPPGAERARTHSAFLPSGPTATKARRIPSGEIAKLYGTNNELGGGSSAERTNGAGGAPRKCNIASTTARATATRVATAATAIEANGRTGD